ncbi:hypothetical protein LguiA_007564 [Lonicera macranthoides]
MHISRYTLFHLTRKTCTTTLTVAPRVYVGYSDSTPGFSESNSTIGSTKSCYWDAFCSDLSPKALLSSSLTAPSPAISSASQVRESTIAFDTNCCARWHLAFGILTEQALGQGRQSDRIGPKKWANKKFVQAAQRLSCTLVELKFLRLERSVRERMTFQDKEKLQEKFFVKKICEKEGILKKVSTQLGCVNEHVRRLELMNST